jgi:flagellar motor component MotA
VLILPPRKKGSNMNKFIGYLLFIATFAGVIFLTGYSEFFIDRFSLLLIFGMVFGVMFLSYGIHAFSAFKYISRPVTSQKEFFLAVSFFDHLSNTAIIAGILGTLLSQLAMLSNVTTTAEIYSGTGASLVSFLYGYLVSKLIFEPLKQNVIRNAKIGNINGLIQLHIDQNNSMPNTFVLMGFAAVVGNFVILISSF